MKPVPSILPFLTIVDLSTKKIQVFINNKTSILNLNKIF